MLGSNSYLGLTNHPKIKEAAKAAVDKLRHRLRRFALPERHAGHPPRAGRGPRPGRQQGGGAALQHRLPGQPRRHQRPGRQGRIRPGRQERPRQHRRRLSALAGRVRALRAQGHGRPGGPPAENRSGSGQTDRRGRRLQHGRRHHPTARTLPPGRTIRRGGDGGRRARHRRAGQSGAPAPPAISA